MLAKVVLTPKEVKNIGFSTVYSFSKSMHVAEERWEVVF